MNSEELEQSLRTEFESYLRNVLADVRQEVSQFRQKIDTEFENHKSHLEEVFNDFSARIEKDAEFDQGFRESIIEHLRLARDEGATITATAIAEAEELAKAERVQTESVSAPAPSADFSDIRNAIYDISSQNSQSAILKSLIDHASNFTSRGAFFVVKNQHFVGWRVFGKQETSEDASIGDVVFPVSSSTVLGDAVRSLSVIESAYGNYPDDAEYLFRLDFGKPSKMFAIPLIARGRGVAAIYADCGKDGENVNIEALETLVSVAGLTVELLAAAQTSQHSRGAVRTAAQPYAPAPSTDEEQFDDQTDVDSVDADSEGIAVEDSAPAGFAAQEEAKFGEAEAVDFDAAADEIDDAPVSEVVEEAQLSDAGDSVEEVELSDTGESIEEVELSDSADISGEIEASPEELPEETGFVVSPVEESSEESKAIADDAVEEIHALPEMVEEVEVGGSEAAAEVIAGEVETAEELAEIPSDSAVEEVSAESFESFATDADAVYDDSDFQPAVEVADASESIPSPPEPVFETNQDFNSSPVQFEQVAGSNEAALDEVVEEVSASPAESAEPTEVAVSAEEEPAEVVAKTVPVPPVKTRFSDRNVELPIDVSEEERRLHNDARRFARLLVSEIKLYNEQKVKEGRESNDLYERLREAIDRSREMYDKRVQPTVVERFDYFHYEVVNNLADGEEGRLGSSYPGSTP